jgi:hypothetical protein
VIPLFIERTDKPIISVYSPAENYLKRRRWNWRRAAESLLVLLAVAFVAVGLPLMMFVSCTGR